LVKDWFLDTSILVAGIVGFRQEPEAAQRILDAVADRRIREPITAWHCCLEFYSVITRVPIEFRLEPVEAERLVREEILARFRVRQLPADRQEGFLGLAVEQGVAGARVYDFHLAQVARAAGASAIVTDNPRHFKAPEVGCRILTSLEAVAELDRSPT
jgi:predicted nucleic acid-binding protein